MNTRPPEDPANSRPDLTTKSRPMRRRGKETFEMILAATGELLAEVGFEKLNTNLVCERAGMTPPALYRYFPNKYALLSELARRLMAAQDAVVARYLETELECNATLGQAFDWHVRLCKELIAVTRAQPGGMWILRAIRAVPVLLAVRNESRDLVIDMQFANKARLHPDVPVQRLRAALMLAEQNAYAAIEMLIEDPQIDEDRIVAEIAWMNTLYFRFLSDETRGRALQDGSIDLLAPPQGTAHQAMQPGNQA